MGYADAACYCLRQAIELATCFAYIHELPEHERQEKLSAWKNHTAWFPVREAMKRKLKNLGGEYADMCAHMPRFFKRVEEINERINKHIHKQGYEYYYTYKTFLSKEQKESVNEKLVREYEIFVEEAIGVVAVIKLVVDPLPVLLADEEVANRLPGLLTEPYSPCFMEKYIGEEAINEFKTTRLYKAYLCDIMKRPRLNDAVYAIKQWNHFDRSSIGQILNQMEQLDYCERLVILLAMSSKKIANVIFHDGLLLFTTDVKSHRSDFSFSSIEYKQFRSSTSQTNNRFKETLLSMLPTYDNDVCFIEHDTPFEDDEWRELCAMAERLNNVFAEAAEKMSALWKSIESQSPPV